MIISDLPVEIQDLVFTEQLAVNNPINSNLELDFNTEDGNFNWHTSVDGEYFWSEINSHNYEPFYLR